MSPTDLVPAEGFRVHLDVFEGPFDLLLTLIAKHELDVTELALARVTDEFLAYLRQMEVFDLSLTSEFVVVAATLLDLKAARLLPGGLGEEQEEDLRLLEAKDLLFARLLQYRAYRQVAGALRDLLDHEAGYVPRQVRLDPEVLAAVPPVTLGLRPEQLAALAAKVLAPRTLPEVSLDHLHVPRVSVADHVLVLTERLTALGSASFDALCRDCREILEVVARFLAALELYRDGRIAFDQRQALEPLQLHWLVGPAA